ncbi:hypothetical protein SeMB42_g01725 [Synchytrium endobioticum]|uniref:Core Histone H2A/H2B/H3 domain-containing protein n=1 Tax=Synchytrium endobioticum TaxID=286115 RepID=A0A507DJV4_9FUNG|nr:hypothetical protein SeMB42_g01725 [Synchytrium endobioticum]
MQQSQVLQAFWNQQLDTIENALPEFKAHALPIARIKKVIKSDHDVKPFMISAEAPMLFARACDIFIQELTLRAWMHAQDNKRRTLQKSDVATAVSKSDMYDFLIDIVPRDLDIPTVPTTPLVLDAFPPYDVLPAAASSPTRPPPIPPPLQPDQQFLLITYHLDAPPHRFLIKRR